MAFRHGKFAVVTIGGTDLSAYGTTLELSIDVDTADSTTFGSTWKSSIIGTAGAKMTFSGNYDGTVTVGPSSAFMIMIAAGVAVAVVHKPGGTLAGQRTNSFNANITSFSESSPVGGIITFKGEVEATGAVTGVTQ